MAPFKTAQELGLTQKQWIALIKTCNGLSNGELKHAPRKSFHGGGSLYENGGFNMGCWTSSCGSVGCIGGWAEMIAGEKLFQNLPTGHHLISLFYPYGALNGDWDNVTPEWAADALCVYLKTGLSGAFCWLKTKPQG